MDKQVDFFTALSFRFECNHYVQPLGHQPKLLLVKIRLLKCLLIISY